jgi:hypothetical protein
MTHKFVQAAVENAVLEYIMPMSHVEHFIGGSNYFQWSSDPFQRDLDLFVLVDDETTWKQIQSHLGLSLVQENMYDLQHSEHYRICIDVQSWVDFVIFRAYTPLSYYSGHDRKYPNPREVQNAFESLREEHKKVKAYLDLHPDLLAFIRNLREATKISGSDVYRSILSIIP